MIYMINIKILPLFMSCRMVLISIIAFQASNEISTFYNQAPPPGAGGAWTSEQSQLVLKENRFGSAVSGPGQQKKGSEPHLDPAHADRGESTFLQMWQKLNLHPCNLILEADAA